ncbi:MAG: hypothetical protein WAQ08_18945 [Aquabacterium sp.]
MSRIVAGNRCRVGRGAGRRAARPSWRRQLVAVHQAPASEGPNIRDIHSHSSRWVAIKVADHEPEELGIEGLAAQAGQVVELLRGHLAGHGAQAAAQADEALVVVIALPGLRVGMRHPPHQPALHCTDLAQLRVGHIARPGLHHGRAMHFREARQQQRLLVMLRHLLREADADGGGRGVRGGWCFVCRHHQVTLCLGRRRACESVCGDKACAQHAGHQGQTSGLASAGGLRGWGRRHW